MSFPRYPKYRDSDIPWIGRLPADWGSLRLANVFRLITRPVRDSDDTITAFRDGEVTLRSKRREEGFTNAVKEIGYQGVRKGDLVIHAMDAFAGAIGVSDSDGKSTPVYSVCTPIHDGITVRYFAFLLRYMALSGFISSLAKGIRERSTDFRWGDARTLTVPIPSSQEQSAIVDFLDQEKAKIDGLIEEQRRLIELLKEKRQAAVSLVFEGNMHHGVTTVGRVKDAVSFVTSGPRGWSDLIDESGALFVQSGDLDDDLNVNFTNCKRVQVEENAETSRTRVRDGDVVVCITGAKTGNVAVMDCVPEPAYVNQHICLLRPKDNVLPRYLAFALKSKAGQAFFDMMQYGMKQGLSLSNVRSAPLPLPSLGQQEASLRQLDSICRELDQVEREARSSISLLKERRSGIISAAVTGKIDVRQPTKKPVASAKPYNSGFAHQLLAATILGRCNDKHMGRVKLQKLIHVTEYHAQIEDLKGEYTRQMAGPLDMKAMAGLERGLEKQHWYKTVREGQRYRYQPLEKKDQHEKYLEQWADKQDRIQEVMTLMGGMNMRQCEIVSTLYAAWNDLLIDGLPATDDAILDQAATAEGWHESKERTPRDKWVAALQWMRQHALIPAGFGSHTRKASPEGIHEPA